MTAHSTGWITLDPNSLWYSIPDGDFNISPLVFDVPYAIRADYEPSNDTMLIRFAYESSEQTVTIQFDNETFFHIGEDSGRVLLIEIRLRDIIMQGHSRDAIDLLKQTAIKLRDNLTGVIKSANTNSYVSSTPNYQVSATAINQHLQDLVKAVA